MRSAATRQAVVGVFMDERGVRDVVSRARIEGLRVHDVYGPYPIHGLDAAMGLRRSRLPWVALAAGAFGLAGAIVMQFYMAVFDWNLNVGGKPDNSLLAFVPIGFELTVLCAGLATAAALCLRCGLFPGARPARTGPGTTDDRFAVVLRRRDGGHDLTAAGRVLAESGARQIAVKTLGIGVVLAAAVTSSACDHVRQRAFEYMPDMTRSVPYDSFAPNPVTRDGKTLQAPVAGTIPRGFLPFRYGPGEGEAERAGRTLVNPVPATPEHLARGRDLYETFCLVCHGPHGKGDGPLVPKIPNPPPYASDRVREFPAGRIYHVITRGAGNMPSYASQIAPDERWLIVLYVRTLQQEGAAR